MRYKDLHESRAAKELKDKLPSLKDPNYDTIDNLMKRISKRYDISGKKLHDLFVSRYGHTPDHWINAYNKKLESVNEFANDNSPNGGNYFQALASAWYNGTFDSGSLQKGIKSQQDVERLLQRGIVCPDGVTRKYAIDYNSDFDGVVISSDDYYEHSDYNDRGQEVDSRTGQPWGPYDYMEFKDEELDEGVAEGTIKDLHYDLQDQQWDAIVGYVINGLKKNMDIGRMELNLHKYAGQELFDVDQALEDRGFSDITDLANHIKQHNGKYVPPTDFGLRDLGEGVAEGLLNEFVPPEGSNNDDRSRRLRKLLEIAIKVAEEQNVGVLNMVHAMNTIASDDFFSVAVEGILPDITDKEYTFILQSAYKTVKQGNLDEFAPPGGDNNDPDEEEILFRLAKQWWLGSEQDMIKAERTLASMGWEIGEDEGYDEGGVFVVRAGDVNGKSYISWSHNDLSELEESGWISKKMKNMPDVDFDKYKGNQLETGSLIDLTKNYQNYKSLVGKILEITPANKAKIKIVAADILPGQKGIVNVGDVISVHTNYLKKSSLHEAIENKKDHDVVKDFIKWTIRRLHIKKPYPRIVLSDNTEKAKKGHHTGVHTAEDNTIWIYTGNRNLIDILRTVFHELVHERQTQLNMIKPGDSYPGSPIEAMADMLAGKYIKIYGKQHPEIFQ